MMRAVAVLSAGLLALSLGAWGGEGNVGGSQCDLIDCSYDELTCQIYAPPNDAYKIFFKRTLDEGWEYAAILVIDLIGVPDPGSMEIVDQEFVDRVLLYRPGTGEQWPDYDGGKLVIKNGGLEEGKNLKGKASFQFENGYFASFAFNCSLEMALPE